MITCDRFLPPALPPRGNSPGDGSEVLVEGRKDPRAPLVVLHRENGPTLIVLPFSVLDSNCPSKVSFPVSVQHALDDLVAERRRQG